jgi:hypothetical protein
MTDKKIKSKEESIDTDKIVIVGKEVIKEKKERGYYLARSIIEIMGKPKEHIELSLKQYVAKISQDARYNLIQYKQEPATNVPDSKEMFTAFAEIEFLAKDLETLMNFVIDYMPASLEVLEPAKVVVDAPFPSNMLTELVGRLHLIDMEYKKSNAQKDFLAKSLGIMIQNSILILLNLGPRSTEGIAQVIGVEIEQTKVFLQRLVAEEKIIEEKGMYKLNKNTPAEKNNNQQKNSTNTANNEKKVNDVKKDLAKKKK